MASGGGPSEDDWMIWSAELIVRGVDLFQMKSLDSQCLGPNQTCYADSVMSFLTHSSIGSTDSKCC